MFLTIKQTKKYTVDSRQWTVQGKRVGKGLNKFFQGPRHLGKYKISSDYWKNWPLLNLFDFVKVVRNIDIFNLEPKIILCFFANVFRSHIYY